MKLLKIDIRNFRAIEDLALSFLDEFGDVRPVTVLAGPNGCGKTSVLLAILQALRGTMGYRTDDVPLPSDLDIRQRTRRPDAWYKTPPPSLQVRLELQFDPVEQEAIPKLFTDLRSSDVPALPDGKLSVTWEYPPGRKPDGSEHKWFYLADTEPELEVVLDWLKARQMAINARKQRKIEYETLAKIGGICFFTRDRDLRQRVLGQEPPEEVETDEMSSVPPSGGNERSHRRTESVAGILKYFSEYARARDEVLPDERNWEKRIQDNFHKICAPKEYIGYRFRGDEIEGAPCFKDGESIYPLEVAASGEQVIIEYLSLLTYPTPLNHSLILMDELEAHVHPRWLRQLYFALPQMGEGNQYILATHSQELRERAAEEGTLVDLGQLKNSQK